MSQIDAQQAIRRYLLGALPQKQAEELEQRLLVDAELYEELLIAEDELVDQFLSGAMPALEQEQVEAHFLRSPERQEQVRFARTLKRYVANQPQPESEKRTSAQSKPVESVPFQKRSFFSVLFPRNPALGFSLACALLVFIVGGVWLTNRILNRPGAPKTVWAIELTPGLTRGDQGTLKFSVPANVDTVRLQLDLTDNQYQSYEADVLDINGRAVGTSKDLKAQAANGRPVVFVDVESKLLAPGDYRVKLSGRSVNGNHESLNSYPFKVLK